MEARAESPEEKASTLPPFSSPRSDYSTEKSEKMGEANPWLGYAIQQALFAQKTVGDRVELAFEVTRARLDQIVSTSKAHFDQTIDSLQDIKSECSVYEGIVIGKIKEGVLIAVSHPLLASGVCIGLGVLGLKRSRNFLYYNTLRLLSSEEALLSRADAKVKDLRKSIDLLKLEGEKLEKRALQAEEEMRRGRTKLRQAGNQIQGVIRSAYKIERQAGGLKDILKDLPSREASRFRSQISNLASEVKKERNVLTKEVTKISNYGISV